MKSCIQESLNRHDLLIQFSKTHRAGKPVTLKNWTVFDQHKEREVKNEDEEKDQASNGKPSTFNGGVLDFRIQGLPHSEVEQAEEGRVSQLVEKLRPILTKEIFKLT